MVDPTARSVGIYMQSPASEGIETVCPFPGVHYLEFDNCRAVKLKIK